MMTTIESDKRTGFEAPIEAPNGGKDMGLVSWEVEGDLPEPEPEIPIE
jgi:hypothetical protein